MKFILFALRTYSFAFLFCTCQILTSAQAEEELAPDLLHKLVKKGQATKSKLAHKTHSWSTIVNSRSPATPLLATDVVQSPTMRSWLFSSISDQQEEVFAYICERDNLWYVHEAGKSPVITRPYEAVFSVPAIYELIALSELRSIPPAELQKKKYLIESQTDDEFLLRRPLNDAQRKQFQVVANTSREGHLDNLQMPDADKDKFAFGINALAELLERGIAFSVDKKSGIISTDTYRGRKIWAGELKWIEDPDPTLFEIDEEEYTANTRSLVTKEEDRENVIVINHAQNWRPNLSVDTQAVLLNTKTGQMSRLPYQRGNIIPGAVCFSSNRELVYISGGILEGYAAAIFELNLISGVHRRLTSPKMLGYMMQPTLSPDGKKLAVAYFSHREGHDLTDSISQVLTIDIASRAITKIGSPLDTSSRLSWMPDGDGLIMIKRENRTLNNNGKSQIIHMSLAGKVTSLVSGSFPDVIAKGNRILFRDEVLGLWKTCDLSGNDICLVGDGLPKFGLPTLSPNDALAIMMKYGGPKGPRPYQVDLTTGASKPLPVGDGFWSTPVWR